MKFKVIAIALLATVIAGCNHPRDEESHEEHEETVIQLVAYSNDFEFFAEAGPLIAGQTSEIISHFTHLPSFKPLESGIITFRLIVNDREISQTLDQPEEKGIYHFELIPEVAGTGRIILDIACDDGSFQLIMPHAVVYGSAEEAHEAAETAEVHTANAALFTKEQSWKIDFATALPARQLFGRVIKTTGQIQSSQSDEIIVTASTNGIVELPDHMILEGQAVSHNQIMLSISGGELSDNNIMVKYTEASNNFERARSEYERAQILSKERIVSEKDLLAAKNQFDNTKAVFDNLNRNITSGGHKVVSPMNGFIKKLHVMNGTYVETGQPIFTVSRNESLIISAGVQQKYAQHLGSIISANIRVLHENKSYTLEQLNGKVLAYGKALNDESYLIPVKLRIDNKGNFIPGSFAELYLKTQSDTVKLTVPNTALLEEQGNFFIYVQLTPERFEKREVKTGSTDGMYTEIINGLDDNERIVTKGAVLVKLAQSTGSLDVHSGHVH